MRILFMNSIGMFGGAEVLWLAMMRALRERDHAVWLCCRPGAEVGERARAMGIPVVWNRFRGDFDPVSVARLAGFMRRERIEVLVTNMDRELRIGGMAARMAGVRAVVPRREIDYPLKNRWQYRWSYNHLASAVVANSRATRSALMRNAPWLDPARIEVIHNGVDARRFGDRQASSRAAALRDEWGIPREAPLAGFVGQLDERKGIAPLLEAFRRVRETVPEARLLLVGRGPLEAWVRGEAAKPDLAGAVAFAGFSDEIPAVMAAVDCLVLPSFWEGFGMVLVEAMAAERAVVASSVSSIPEIVADGETGWLVPPGDASALASRISALLANAALRERMGRAGRERVLAEFTLDRMVERHEALFRRLLTREGAAAGAGAPRS